jgi:hypothetical membrane protein
VAIVWGVLRVRELLVCGVVGALLFIAVLLVNDAVKPGYEPVRDFVSEAAIGRGGWVQITNFLVSGALITVFSLGLRQTVSRWTAWLVRAFGICLMAAGAFVSDPVPSDHQTWHGVAHNLVSVVVFGAVTAACFTAARWRPSRWWRFYCLITGVAVPVLFVLAAGVSGTTGVFQRLSIIVGWVWLAVLGLRALRLDGVWHAGRSGVGGVTEAR